MNFLGFKKWRVLDVLEEKTHYFVRATYEGSGGLCPNCSQVDSVHRYGSKKRVLKDAPIRGKSVTILLSIQTYFCTICRRTFNDDVSEINGPSRLTKRLLAYIIKQCCAKKNFYEVALETSLSESTVREIFTQFAENHQHRLKSNAPRILGIDDVYIARLARCILTDIEQKRVIEILPRKTVETVYSYLCSIKAGGATVEVVTMDMHRPFWSMVRDSFGDAKIVIDTFHVQRNCNKAIMNFLTNVRKSLNISQRRVTLRDRFLLLRRYFNLSAVERGKLNDWKSKWAELAEIHDLKEEFFTIWRHSKREDGEAKYQNWKSSMSPQARAAFDEIIATIENWYEEIFNYFDYRYTNAFTESCNGLIKRMQSEGRGYDYETIRAKILFGYCIDSIPESELSLIKKKQENENLSRVERLQAARLLHNKYKDLPDDLK